MILKIKLGSGARGLLNYISQTSKTANNHTRPFFTNMAGKTPRELAAEVAALRKLKPNLTKAVAHLSLSADPQDRAMTDDEWRQAITIALAKHGANKAAFAVYRHRDTSHDHTHCFFLRVQTDGLVVSDSHSFRKNEAASRQIELELQLNTPTPTPVNLKPSDREATSKAQRRAERRGSAYPAVDAAKVRLALAEALDMVNFKQLLLAEGIEAEFDRRGQDQSVYGWRLRRQGIDEWLKASSLARDLSWPKIAHRFENDMNAEVAEQEQVAITKKARRDDDHAEDRARDKKQDRRPVILRGILQPGPKVNVDLPKRTNNIARADIAPLSKAMLLVGIVALKLSAAAIGSLINFVRWLLAKFSFRLAPAARGSAQGQTALPFELRYVNVESRIVPESFAPTAFKNASAKLMQVANAIEKNDPDLLPQGQGRDELAASMLAAVVDDADADFSPEPRIKQDAMDKLFPVPKSAFFRELNGLINDALAALDRAVKAQLEAEFNADDAPKIEPHEVVAVKEKLVLAERTLVARNDRHYFEKAEVPRFLKFAFPSLKRFSAKEIAAVNANKVAVAVMVKKHPARVPEHLNAALHQARIGSVRAAELAVNEQKKMLSTMKDGDVEFFKVAKSRIGSFEAQAKLLVNLPSVTQAQITLKSGYDAINKIAAKRQELEEAARLDVQRALEVSSQKHVLQNDQENDDALSRRT